MMVATDVAFFQFGVHVVLHHRRAAEFSAPDDQGFFEQTTLIEIPDQPRDQPCQTAGI